MVQMVQVRGRVVDVADLLRLARARGVEVLIVDEVRLLPSGLDRLIEEAAARMKGFGDALRDLPALPRFTAALAECGGDPHAWRWLPARRHPVRECLIRHYLDAKHRMPRARHRPRGALGGRFAFYQGAF